MIQEDGLEQIGGEGGGGISYQIAPHKLDLFFYDEYPSGSVERSSSRNINNGLEIPELNENWGGLKFSTGSDTFEVTSVSDGYINLKSVRNTGWNPKHDQKYCYNKLKSGSWTLIFTPVSAGNVTPSVNRDKDKNGLEIPNDDENWIGLKFYESTYPKQHYTVYKEERGSVWLEWKDSSGERGTTDYSKDYFRKSLKGGNWTLIETPVSASVGKTGRVVSAGKPVTTIIKGAVPNGRILRGKEKKTLLASAKVYSQIITD